MEIRIIFTFNGMSMLYLETFCPRKFNGGNQNFENWRRFSLVFVKNSNRHARNKVFWKRTLIMATKDDHKSCVLTRIATNSGSL